MREIKSNDCRDVLSTCWLPSRMSTWYGCVCTRVCACVCTHIQVCMCMHLCVHTRAFVHVCARARLCACVCACARGCVCMHTHVCTSAPAAPTPTQCASSPRVFPWVFSFFCLRCHQRVSKAASERDEMTLLLNRSRLPPSPRAHGASVSN